MGLLEKALAYKKEINRKGVETLIDRIQGPAETDLIEFNPDDSSYTESEMSQNVRYIDDQTGEEKKTADTHSGAGYDRLLNDDDTLFDLPEDEDASPLSILEEQKNMSFNSSNKINTEAKQGSHGINILPEVKENNPLGPEDEPVLMKSTEAQADLIKKNPGIPTEKPGRSVKTDIKNNIPAVQAYNEAEKKKDLPRIQILNAEPVLEKYPERGTRDSALNDSLNDEIDHEHINQDLVTIYEMEKEISRVETQEELYKVIHFLVMGQLGTSSSSILIEDNKNWHIVSSSGIKISNEQIYFDPAEGIINELNNDILDLETYRSRPDLSDQYNKLLSIDTRLLCPIKYKDQLFGALILGDKITGDAYSDDDKNLILSICEASAAEFNKLKKINKLQSDNEKLRNDILTSSRFHDLQEEIIRHSSMKTLGNAISREFEKLGVTGYAVFISYNKDDDYVPQFIEEEDFLSLMDPLLKIDHNSMFITYIEKMDRSVLIEDMESPMLIEVFTENRIKKMSILALYPFKIGIRLIGFTAVFRVREDINMDDLDINLQQFSKVLFPGILTTKKIDIAENQYTDSFEPVSRRIKSQLENSKDLNIPLTLILFSIKNFKRYSNLYGYNQAKDLTDTFIGIIKSKLSDTDFASRYGRNKILIVLPGKDKKFATPFATAIRSELMQKFRKREKQLLITFLTSEYPADGENMTDLLDNIE